MKLFFRYISTTIKVVGLMCPVFLYAQDAGDTSGVIPQLKMNLSESGIYVYNDGKDTIQLAKPGMGGIGLCDSFAVVREIQIDGKGAREIMFRRSLSYNASNHGGTFDEDYLTEIVLYEIWNLDTKALLFTAINKYAFQYDYFRQAFPANESGKGTDKYSYELVLHANGNIRIQNYKGTRKAKTDHKPGLYSYVNGGYIRAD